MRRIDLTSHARRLRVRDAARCPTAGAGAATRSRRRFSTTSLVARTAHISPVSLRYSTPVAAMRPGEPSSTTRVTWAPVMIVRLGRRFGILLEERVVGARPPACPRGRLEERHDAGRATPVVSVIVTARYASRHGGLHELTRALEYRGAHGHPKGAGGAVRGRVDGNVVAGLESLALPEVRQHLAVAPPGGTALRPGVEVTRVATHVSHVVHPRGCRRASCPAASSSAPAASPSPHFPASAVYIQSVSGFCCNAGHAAENPAAGGTRPASRRATLAGRILGEIEPR